MLFTANSLVIVLVLGSIAATDHTPIKVKEQANQSDISICLQCERKKKIFITNRAVTNAFRRKPFNASYGKCFYHNPVRYKKMPVHKRATDKTLMEVLITFFDWLKDAVGGKFDKDIQTKACIDCKRKLISLNNGDVARKSDLMQHVYENILFIHLNAHRCRNSNFHRKPMRENNIAKQKTQYEKSHVVKNVSGITEWISPHDDAVIDVDSKEEVYQKRIVHEKAPKERTCLVSFIKRTPLSCWWRHSKVNQNYVRDEKITGIHGDLFQRFLRLMKLKCRKTNFVGHKPTCIKIKVPRTVRQGEKKLDGRDKMKHEPTLALLPFHDTGRKTFISLNIFRLKCQGSQYFSEGISTTSELTGSIMKAPMADEFKLKRYFDHSENANFSFILLPMCCCVCKAKPFENIAVFDKSKDRASGSAKLRRALYSQQDDRCSFSRVSFLFLLKCPQYWPQRRNEHQVFPAGSNRDPQTGQSLLPEEISEMTLKGSPNKTLIELEEKSRGITEGSSVLFAREGEKTRTTIEKLKDSMKMNGQTGARTEIAPPADRAEKTLSHLVRISEEMISSLYTSASKQIGIKEVESLFNEGKIIEESITTPTAANAPQKRTERMRKMDGSREKSNEESLLEREMEGALQQEVNKPILPMKLEAQENLDEILPSAETGDTLKRKAEEANLVEVEEKVHRKFRERPLSTDIGKVSGLIIVERALTRDVSHSMQGLLPVTEEKKQRISQEVTSEETGGTNDKRTETHTSATKTPERKKKYIDEQGSSLEEGVASQAALETEEVSSRGTAEVELSIKAKKALKKMNELKWPSRKVEKVTREVKNDLQLSITVGKETSQRATNELMSSAESREETRRKIDEKISSRKEAGTTWAANSARGSLSGMEEIVWMKAGELESAQTALPGDEKKNRRIGESESDLRIKEMSEGTTEKSMFVVQHKKKTGEVREGLPSWKKVAENLQKNTKMKSSFPMMKEASLRKVREQIKPLQLDETPQKRKEATSLLARTAKSRKEMKKQMMTERIGETTGWRSIRQLTSVITHTSSDMKSRHLVDSQVKTGGKYEVPYEKLTSLKQGLGQQVLDSKESKISHAHEFLPFEPTQSLRYFTEKLIKKTKTTALIKDTEDLVSAEDDVLIETEILKEVIESSASQSESSNYEVESNWIEESLPLQLNRNITKTVPVRPPMEVTQTVGSLTVMQAYETRGNGLPVHTQPSTAAVLRSQGDIIATNRAEDFNEEDETAEGAAAFNVEDFRMDNFDTKGLKSLVREQNGEGQTNAISADFIILLTLAFLVWYNSIRRFLKSFISSPPPTDFIEDDYQHSPDDSDLKIVFTSTEQPKPNKPLENDTAKPNAKLPQLETVVVIADIFFKSDGDMAYQVRRKWNG